MIQVQRSKDKTGIEIIGFEGDFDYHASGDLRGALNNLADEKAEKILFDFQKVSYIDSTGIAAFVEFYQRSKIYGGKFVIFGLLPGIRQIFEIVKLHLFFPFAATREEALNIINS